MSTCEQRLWFVSHNGADSGVGGVWAVGGGGGEESLLTIRSVLPHRANASFFIADDEE